MTHSIPSFASFELNHMAIEPWSRKRDLLQNCPNLHQAFEFVRIHSPLVGSDWFFGQCTIHAIVNQTTFLKAVLPVSSILGYAQCTINVEGFHNLWTWIGRYPKLLAKLVVWSSRSAWICAAHSKVFARSIVHMGWRIGWRLNKSTIVRSSMLHLWGTDCWVGCEWNSDMEVNLWRER